MNIKYITECSKNIQIDLSDIKDKVLQQEVHEVVEQYKQYIDKQILIGLGLPTTILLNDSVPISNKTYTLSDIQCILDEEQNKGDKDNG